MGWKDGGKCGSLGESASWGEKKEAQMDGHVAGETERMLERRAGMCGREQGMVGSKGEDVGRKNEGFVRRAWLAG